MDGVAIEARGHRTLLKWHRLRRRADDPPFTAARLAEGVRLGAAMEVDLRCHAADGFVCLHDTTLDRESTGTGPIRAATPDALRALHVRNAGGTAGAQRVLLFEDLVALTPPDSGATVQLDCKETLGRLTPAAIAAFAREVAPRAPRFILSGHDWQAVTVLASGIDGLRIGYDPCETPQALALRTRDDFRQFADAVAATAPEAGMIYLAYRLLLRAADQGEDLVDAFHRQGRLVDAYTLNPSHADAAHVLRRLVDAKVDQITTDESLALEAMWDQAKTG